MLHRIVRKELTEALRDGRLGWAAGVALLLVAAASVTAWQQAEARSVERAQAAERQHELWQTQPDQNPHGAAHDGLNAFKPVTPLSVIDPGVDAVTGRVIAMQAHGSQEATFRPMADASGLQRFGALTLALLLQVVMPLLVVLLTFDSVAGERERGTLRQLAGAGVSLHRLALGKALAAATIVVALLAPVGLAIGVIAGATDGGGDGWRRAALMGAGYAAYLAGFACVSLAVSARAQTTRAALLTMIGIWIVMAALAPRVGVDLAVRLSPALESPEFRTRINRDLDQGISGHNPRGEREEAFRQDVLKQYGVASVDALPVNFDGLLMQADEEYADTVYERHVRDLWDAYERQERWQLAFLPGAPVLAMRTLSMHLAGTGLADHRAFATAAERYRRDLMRTLNHDMTVNSRTGDWDYRSGSALWSSVPPFDYVPPPLDTSTRVIWLSALVLAAWVAVSAGAAAWALTRVRVD